MRTSTPITYTLTKAQLISSAAAIALVTVLGVSLFDRQAFATQQFMENRVGNPPTMNCFACHDAAKGDPRAPGYRIGARPNYDGLTSCGLGFKTNDNQLTR